MKQPLRSLVCGAVSLGILNSCGIRKGEGVTQPVSWKANQVWHGEIKKFPKYIINGTSKPASVGGFVLASLGLTIITCGVGILYIPGGAYANFHDKKEPVQFDLLVSKIDSNGNFSGYWCSDKFEFWAGVVSGKMEGSSIKFDVTSANNIVNEYHSCPGVYTGKRQGEEILGKGKSNSGNIGSFLMKSSSLSSSSFMQTYRWHIKKAEEERQRRIKNEREAKREQERRNKEHQIWLQTPEGRAYTMKEEQDARDRETQRALDEAKTKAEENEKKIKALNSEVDKLKASSR